MLANIIFTLLLKRLYTSNRVDRYYLCSINRNAGRYHPCTTIESHYWRR